jgi:two-component system NtrC family sensor kinase
MNSMRFSIKAKLTIATLIPLSVAIFICWLTGVFIINTKIVGQAQDKVRNDLNAAREVYLNEIGHIRDVVKFTASAPYTADAFAEGKQKGIGAILTPLKRTENLDVFMALDATGRVLYRANNPGAFGDDQSQNQFAARALKGEIVSGTSLIPPADMAVEGAQLAGQAAITVLATPRARPARETMERAGMMLISAAPVRDDAGNIIGALCGGVLLNNNNTLVDKIKSIVYEGVQADGKDVGSATIFLGDLRIATNVLTSAGTRAIGTRLSEEVYNRVILRKEKWLDRAFVVNDWYFTAYEPILSLEGVPIGSLYVGMMEKPYTAIKFNLGFLFSGVLLLGALIGLAVSGFLATRLARPVRELENAARRVAAGERDVRFEVASQDEIGDLAEEFNEMTRTLAQREKDIGELNRGLEQKVLERTAELEEKNRLLVKTREELVRAEKLAAIGELAAGVAHEINNPMAIIRGNTELLQMSIPPKADNREEVDTIFQQTGRVERIVANLLRFARQEQKHLGEVFINRLLHEILSQVSHQAPLSGIFSEERYSVELQEIKGDSDQLRQVFTNLILNAIQAMPEGGKLTIETILHAEAGVCEVDITDTGYGIAAENLEQIFNPFFTTKKQGTGLGLSVTYGIIKEHGGRIDVQSEPGKETTFRVVLPVKQSGNGEL